MARALLSAHRVQHPYASCNTQRRPVRAQRQPPCAVLLRFARTRHWPRGQPRVSGRLVLGMRLVSTTAVLDPFSRARRTHGGVKGIWIVMRMPHKWQISLSACDACCPLVQPQVQMALLNCP